MQRTPRSASVRSLTSKKAATTALVGLTGLLLAGLGTTYAQHRVAADVVDEARSHYVEPEKPTASSGSRAHLSLPEDPSVLIMGDSFAEGFGAKPRSKGYAFMLGTFMGWDDVTVDHEGRTGFVADNKGLGKAYPARLKDLMNSGITEPDLVILQGSINDSSGTNEEIQAAVNEALISIDKAWSDTDIVVTAPITYRSFARIESALSASLAEHNVVYLNDGIPRAWLPQSPELYAPDTWHPSTEGHARIARTMSEALRARTN
jgi:acyl-CoA thioesterase-1